MILSFQEVAASWKADKRRWVKASTYAVYVHHVNTHILPYFCVLGAEGLTEAAIQDFVNRKLEQGLCVKSVRDTLVVLRMILHHGTKLGAWPPVTYDVHFPTAAEARAAALPILSPGEQKRLQTHLQANFSFRNLGILICLNSGLRIGEVCGLQWKDLDVVAGVIHVTKTVQRIWLRDGEERSFTLSVGSPKTATSVRDVPISGDLMKIIRPLRKVMAPDYYVVSNQAAPLEPRYYRDYFRKELTRLGMTPVRFHALRHSFATRCIESRCDYKTVSVILGHASISTTMDLYVHPGLAEKRRCIERMSRLLSR